MKYNPNSEITRVNSEAAKLGLTYGIYVAQQYERGKNVRSKIERQKRKAAPDAE